MEQISGIDGNIETSLKKLGEEKEKTLIL